MPRVTTQRAGAPRPRGRPATGSEPVGDRDDFLDAALEVFADIGYEGASMRALARELGVSHRLLQARFGSKRELWEAAVDHGMSRLEERTHARLAEAAIDDGDLVERLRSFLVEFLLALADAPATLKLMNYEGARDSDRLEYVASRFLHPGMAPFRELVEEGVARGRLRDVSVTTLFLVAAHGGGALFCLRPLASQLGVRARRSPATLRSQAEEVADLMIAGLARRRD